jgi:hypothetical protein
MHAQGSWRCCLCCLWRCPWCFFPWCSPSPLGWSSPAGALQMPLGSAAAPTFSCHVATATGYGLAVQAVGGGPSWTGELGYLGQLLVKLVGDYNANVTARERLQGTSSTSSRTSRAAGTTTPRPASTATSPRSRASSPPTGGSSAGRPAAASSWASPSPSGSTARATPPGAVAFNGATKPAARHLVDMLRDLSRAYLVIMSYRNFTGSDDGSIAHTRNELWYAHRIKAKCGLLVGQQYGLVSPEYITFNGHRRRTFQRAAAQITAAFQRYSQFRGLTVGDVDSYMAARP